MAKAEDLIGLRFDRLVVLKMLPNRKPGIASWLCKCDCGNETTVDGIKLRAERTKSCGCLKAEYGESKVNDLSGKVFGKLTVLKRAGSNSFKKALWLCSCECGNDTTVVGSDMLNGHTTSCGCVKAAGQYNVVHGHNRETGCSKAYTVWKNMLSRCRNPNIKQYKDYGGRGVSVCERWLKFENFLEDMGEPQERLQIDRIDNDGSYTKENCRWVTRSQNRRNSRGHVVVVNINGEEMLIVDAVRRFKVVAARTAYARINLGWTPEEAVMTPYTRCDNKGFR